MKRFVIPLIDKHLYIYVGESEWKSYYKVVNKEVPDTLKKPYPGKDSGRAYGSWVWVDVKDRNLLIHELSHFIDDTLDFVDIKDHEFRAYLTAWVIDTVLKWVENDSK